MAATMLKKCSQLDLVKPCLYSKQARLAPVCKANNRGSDSVSHLAASTLVATSLLASSPMMPSADALTYDQRQSLSYTQIKGTGLANTCPTVDFGTTNTREALKPGNYKLQNFCMEPTSFKVKEENSRGEEDFVPTKLLTRLSYSLEGMEGEVKIGNDGSMVFREDEGMDYQATTVRPPGGEYVPFLFTIKKFEGKGDLDTFSGDFLVPSYRGSTFMDPRARGGTTGYDWQVGLAAASQEDEYSRTNNKNLSPGKGSAVFSLAKVDPETGEVAGIFESIQPSDTEMGAHPPKDIKVTGLWYGQLTQEGL